jgi:hypothetical protein
VRLAPGWLGRSSLGGIVGIAIAVAGGALLGLATRSRGAGEDVYAGIARLLQRNKVMDPSTRMARLASLRLREARMVRLRRVAALLVPGAAGLQAGHGLVGLVAAALATFGVIAWRARPGLLPDPLAASETAAFAFGLAAALAGIGYVAALAASLALLRRRSGP